MSSPVTSFRRSDTDPWASPEIRKEPLRQGFMHLRPAVAPLRTPVHRKPSNRSAKALRPSLPMARPCPRPLAVGVPPHVPHDSENILSNPSTVHRNCLVALALSVAAPLRGGGTRGIVFSPPPPSPIGSRWWFHLAPRKIPTRRPRCCCWCGHPERGTDRALGPPGAGFFVVVGAASVWWQSKFIHTSKSE